MLNVLETYTVNKIQTKNIKICSSFFIWKNLNQFAYALSVNRNFSVHDLGLQTASLHASDSITNNLKN